MENLGRNGPQVDPTQLISRTLIDVEFNGKLKIGTVAITDRQGSTDKAVRALRKASANRAHLPRRAAADV